MPRLWNHRAVAAAAICLLPAAAGATVPNGDFEDGLNGWSTSGDVIGVFAGDPLFSNVAYISGSGRLWQTVTLPSGAESYSFRYIAIDVPHPGDSGPPLNDSLSVFILDPNTLETIVPPAPGFEGTHQFFLRSRSGLAGINADYVTVVEPDVEAEELGTVNVNLAALPGPLPAAVRIEFGVSNGNDGFRTDVIIDDVQITVPSPGGAMILLAGWATAAVRRSGGRRRSPSGRNGSPTRSADAQLGDLRHQT